MGMLLGFGCGLASAGVAMAQPTTETAKRFISLLLGQQALVACHASPSATSVRVLDAELARRRAAQSELSAGEIEVATERLRQGLSAPANRATVCRQLDEMGADRFVALIVTQ